MSEPHRVLSSRDRGRVVGGMVAVAILLACSEAPRAAAAPPRGEPYGRLADGREARTYVLEADGGWRATLTDHGAALVSFVVPQRSTADGEPVDVVLGFDTLEAALAKRTSLGAVCGRCADRIATATFDLDGAMHRLTANDGMNHARGGRQGFDTRLWRASPRSTARGAGVSFELVSPGGDEGYPGTLTARVSYTLTPTGSLMVEMSATSDAPTIVNLAHRCFWNLAGHASGSIAGHELAVEADRYLPVGPDGIPTGAFAPVAGTPFDFRPERRPWRPCGAAIETLPPDAPPGTPRGVDHTYLVRGWKPDGRLRTVARLRDPASGRSLEVRSDQPAVYVGMGGEFDGRLVGKDGAAYEPNAGICLGPWKYPDAVHHVDWPSVRLDPGQVATHVTVYHFTR
jgi:aldose 1-epimerase